MQYNRRKFIKLTGSAAAGISLASMAGFEALSLLDETPKKIKKFGIQLYTVRDVFEKDPKGILKQIAAMGYNQIESYERNQGLFWGMKNTEFKSYVNDLGMDFVASHTDASKNIESKAAESAAIGLKYLIHAWEGGDVTIDGYKKLAEDFNRYGAICKQNGLRFAFHNHSFSFETREGQIPQKILLDNTDPTLVDFEMDMYWVVVAGQDPEEWLKKYPDRFRFCHIKDRVKGSTKKEDTCELGKGSINYAPILKTACKNGMKYFITEQEHYPGTTSMQSAAANAAYMKTLKL